jgi:ribonuclease P protein component
VWVRFAPGDAGPPAVGYAIGRPVGSAVVRNRLRRRLRAVIAGLAPDLAGGDYLVGATPQASELTFSQLSAAVATAVHAVGAA